MYSASNENPPRCIKAAEILALPNFAPRAAPSAARCSAAWWPFPRTASISLILRNCKTFSSYSVIAKDGLMYAFYNKIYKPAVGTDEPFDRERGVK